LTLGAVVQVRASGTPAPTPVPVVFVGRITDITVRYPDGGFPEVSVIAADQLADQANRFVGSEPWAVETAQARGLRILTAIGSGPHYVMNARTCNVVVSRVDVDRQSAATLFYDLAITT